jgi:NAD(P)-dependent dehydrogenase (short-subunit alcohol dehydrogenase family)
MSSTKEIVWITGASSGIGRALALRMAREGWRVAASARRAGELDALKTEAAKTGGEIAPFPLDTTKPEEVRRTVARIEGAGADCRRGALRGHLRACARA